MMGRTGKQFLRNYTLFFFCLVLLFIPFYYINFSMVSRNYIDNASALLRTGLANFEDDLSHIEAISRSAFSDPRFRRFSYMGTDLSILDYYYTITLVNDFNRYFSAAGMIEDCGFVFSNDTVLTSKMLHFSGTDFYGIYFMQKGVPEFQQWAAEMSAGTNYSMISASLFPQASFSSLQLSYDAITYVQNFSNFPERTSFFFATLKSEYILSRLATDEVLQEGKVIMHDPTGKILLESNPGNISGGNKVITVSMTGEKRGILVTVDVPRRVFAKMMASYRLIAFIFTLVFIAVGAVLSIIFSQRSAKPVREIMEETLSYIGYDLPDESPGNSKNNFTYIQNFISQAKWNYKVFTEKLKQQEEFQRKNFFGRLLYSPVYSTEIHEYFKNFLPDFPPKFRIAAMDLPGMDEATLTSHTVRETMITDLIGPKIPPGGYCLFLGSILAMFLPEDLPDAPPADGKGGIVECLHEISAELRNKMNISARIALSETVEDIQDTYGAFSLVRHLLWLPRNTHESEILQKENAAPFSFSTDFPDTSHFYEFLLRGEEEKSVSFINNVLNELRRREYTDENDIFQIFFLCRRILIKITDDLKLDIEKETIVPNYDSHEDINLLFDKMIESIRKMCGIIRMQYDEKNAEFEQAVVRYVDAHITNTSLYTRMVTVNFKINENRLQNIFRHWTGKSYLEYVESKRMIIAKELLQTTNKAISVITKECGYTTENAFYKAFRRFYGMAPTDLRRQ